MDFSFLYEGFVLLYENRQMIVMWLIAGGLILNFFL